MNGEHLKLTLVIFALSIVCSGVAIGIAAYFDEMQRERDLH